MFRRFLGAIIVVFAGTSAFAEEFGTREEAIAMIVRLQATFAEIGAEATFAMVTDKSTDEFRDRDLYPFIYSFDGVCVAHGAKPILVGKNLIGLKDQDGKVLVLDMINIAKNEGSGWYDYKWPNPITNKIENKSSYVERMGDYMVGVGVYR